MAVNINFTKPELISQGIDRDTAYVSIKNPALFVSKETGVPFDPKLDPVIKVTFPRQLPPGVNGPAMEDQAK